MVMRDGVSPSTVALPPGPWPTVLEFLCERFPNIHRTIWLERLRAGLVLDEHGLPVGESAGYRPHHKISYYRHVPQEPRIPFDETVLYQDEHLVVADKPHFLPVTPGGRHVQETLLVRLKRKLGLDTLSPVHRIDLETAGLVVFSVNPSERAHYHALFRAHQVTKQYLAIAPYRAGLVWPRTLSSRLEEDPQVFMQMREVPGEPNAHTEIDVLEIRGSWALYALRPRTGRKHQLRVHMASLGLPLACDRIYPVLQPPVPGGEHGATWQERQALRLLAQRLSFTCPLSGRLHQFESTRALSFDWAEPTG